MQHVGRYAELGSSALADKLAAKFDLDAQRIVTGFGSDDLLARLARAYLHPGQELIYSVNGYQKIPNYAFANDATPVAVSDKEFTANVDAILSAVTSDTGMVMLANPDNPTGTYMTGSEVRRLHTGLPSEVLLVLDSAYLEYCDTDDFEDPTALVREHPNVVMTRTFSKLFGLAGLRLGWMYASLEIADVIRTIGITFPVSNVALACGLTVLEDEAHTTFVKTENSRVRSQFCEGLANLGIKTYPTQTNFVLAEFPDEIAAASAVYEHLRGQGILARRFGAQAFKHCIRFTIGSGEEMEQVLNGIRNSL